MSSVPTSLVLASEVIGFLSFGFTLLTAIGVYSDLIKTLRSAPATIPISLGNIREEIGYEQALCKQGRKYNKDQFHVLPTQKHMRKRRQEYGQLIQYTLKHLWTEFCDIEKRFLLDGEKVSENIDSDDDRDGADEKGSGDNRRRSDRPRPTHRQTYIRSRMGWIEAGLSRDRMTYYNTDLAHRFLWWWKQNDINNLAQQLQRLQIRRIERDSYEANILVKRALSKYGRATGDDVYTDSDDSSGNGGGGGGSGSDDNGGPRGGHGHRRRHSGVASSNTHGRRKRRNTSINHKGVREVSEKEVIRRRAPSPEDLSPPRRPASAVGSQRERPPRGSVVYEYEVVDPGRVHVEYASPRQDQIWREGRQRSYSRPRRESEH